MFSLDDDLDNTGDSREAHARSYNKCGGILKLASQLSSTLIDLYVSYCNLSPPDHESNVTCFSLGAGLGLGLAGLGLGGYGGGLGVGIPQQIRYQEISSVPLGITTGTIHL